MVTLVSLKEARVFLEKFYNSLEEYVPTVKTSEFFPLDPFSILSFTAHDSVNFWIDVYDNFKEQRIVFPKTTALRLELVSVLIECKIINTPIGDRLKIISIFKYLLEHGPNKDPFCERGAFIENFQELSPEYLTDKILHGKLIVALMNWVWSIYGDTYNDISFEAHGPYECNGYQFIVRDYNSLTPLEFWKINFNLPTVRIISRYKNNSLHIGVYNHVRSNTDLFDTLQGFQVLLNNDLASKEEIEYFVKRLSLACIDQYQQFSSLSLNEKMEKIFLFRRKNFEELIRSLDINYNPTETVLRKLRTSQPLQVSNDLIYADDLLTS